MAVPRDDIIRTRRALHAIAEHLLAADRWHHHRRIGLRPTPGGFGTPAEDVAGALRRLTVDRRGVTVRIGGDVTTHPFTTIGELGRACGVVPGAPSQVYAPSTSFEPDRPLDIDPDAVDHLAAFLEITATALEQLVASRPGRAATEAQLWPEHFDLAISMDEVNYGGCLGDDGWPLPYLYVGPFDIGEHPRIGEYWNAPWGAGREWDGTADVADATAWFAEGATRAAG